MSFGKRIPSEVTTYRDGCQLQVNGNGHSLDAAADDVRPDPLGWLTEAHFDTDSDTDGTQCTFSQAGTFDLSCNGAWWVGGKKYSKQLMPDVSCATGPNRLIKLGDSGVCGNVTFIAARVDLLGNSLELTPFKNSVLAWTAGTSDSAIAVSGNVGNWSGYLYAPDGQAELAATKNFTLCGSVIAWTTELSGNGWTITP